MKKLLFPAFLFISVCSFSQTFRIDSIGHREGRCLPLFEKSTGSIKVFYWRIWGAGKPIVKLGDIGTIVMRKEKLVLTFKK